MWCWIQQTDVLYFSVSEVLGGEQMVKRDLSVFIADGARIIGDVTLEEGSSVWYNAVIRAEMASVTIGRNSNIQDLVMIHVDENYPVSVGEGVTVGHSAILHGCTVEDNVVIGMGAIILNGARIRKNSIVGAGALVTQKKDFPEGSLILGSPAGAVRQLTPGEIARNHHSADVYARLAREQASERVLHIAADI